MFRFLLIFSFLFSVAIAQVAERKTICLNMIVKNEKEVICRCLESVKPFINYWVIVDTGSTDNTMALTRECLRGIPGELHERPWINFEENRNQALQLAKEKADYVLFIDADEVLQYAPTFSLPSLDKDLYFIKSDYNGIEYARISLVNNNLDWKWRGILHEILDHSLAKTSETLIGIKNIIYTDGARSRNPEKSLKDIRTLEGALKLEPNNLRYIFYLAQTLKDAGKYEQAIENYHKRIAMGKGMDEEVFWSMLQIGVLQAQLEKRKEQVIDQFLKTYLINPNRAEILFYLAHYYRSQGDYFSGYLAAKQGLTIPAPENLHFVEKWIYDYGLLKEYSICCFCLEKYQEALIALYLMLNKNLPVEVRTATLKNIILIEDKLRT